MAKQLKEIEIPFGAKDSELYGWEYTIPEGMEATIVDNKIVVKKKESEDERIRGAIIDHLKDNNLTEWAAWLEKQGKNNMGISEATKKELEDNLNKTLEKETQESCNEFLDEQGEQKSTIEMKTPEESLGIDSDTYNKIVDECVYGEQKPIKEHNACEFCADRYGCVSPCSMKLIEKEKPADLPKGEDYDIDGLYAAIDILQKTLGEVDGYQSDDGILEHKCAISAVKELSKQKPAWSEEDEEMFYAVIADIRFTQKAHNHEVNQVVYEREIDWFKSLKERYTWKPSDEQMDALNLAIGEANSVDTAAGDEAAEILTSLYQQLKKLREE